MQHAVSSTAFRGKPIDEAARIAHEAGLVLEFSSGVPHRPDLVELFPS